MASSRLFRLKSEVASATSPVQASTSAFVRVRVDTGVFHLDDLYDYVIPEKFTKIISVGVRVQVPFGNREVEGIIVERTETPERAGTLKFITKVLSPHPIATTESLKLIDHIAAAYACNPWDVIRSAIPPRVTSVDKKFDFASNAGMDDVDRLNRGMSRVGSDRVSDQRPHTFSFMQLAPVIPAVEQIAAAAKHALRQGSVLIIAPDDKDVDQILKEFKNAQHMVLKLTSSMPRNERYESFLQCQRQAKKLVVGTRGSVFAPISNVPPDFVVSVPLTLIAPPAVLIPPVL